jgi:hypothetical protein
VAVGSGLRWIDVYTELEPLGIMSVGARLPDVGVGGFLLGGGESHPSTIDQIILPTYVLLLGFSWYSGKFGLSADNVVAYEVNPLARTKLWPWKLILLDGSRLF